VKGPSAQRQDTGMVKQRGKQPSELGPVQDKQSAQSLVTSEAQLVFVFPQLFLENALNAYRAFREEFTRLRRQEEMRDTDTLSVCAYRAAIAICESLQAIQAAQDQPHAGGFRSSKAGPRPGWSMRRQASEGVNNSRDQHLLATQEPGYENFPKLFTLLTLAIETLEELGHALAPQKQDRVPEREVDHPTARGQKAVTTSCKRTRRTPD